MEPNRQFEFWSKVKITDGCWLWTGGFFTNGYGSVWIVNHAKKAHVVHWEMKNGPVPVGKDLHHTCGNRACVRLDHLVPLTRAEHRQQHKKEFCKRGHARTPENIDWIRRECLICKKLMRRRYRENVGA